MKKVILALSLLFVAAPTQCGFFDTAMTYLKNNGVDLLKKGIGLISDNSETILKFVNDSGALDKAKELLFGKTKEEADKEEKAIIKKAEEIIQKNPALTPTEQAVIIKEAAEIAKRNRVELEKVARESIDKKRAALKQSMYDKFGKGTPTST